MSIKILYIEDEGFLGKIVKESLESRKFEVFMEADGAKAIGLFNSCAPDICVLDVMLPNKDGFKIAEEIRATGSNVPILFLTAKSQTEDLVKGFKLGGNDYIKKPFSMEELIVRIENSLKNGNEKQSFENKEVIRLGKYNFFTAKQLLIEGEKVKKLSYKEAELLKILYFNKKSLLTGARYLTFYGAMIISLTAGTWMFT